MVARHHGTSEAGLDGRTCPGTLRRHFTRRLRGDGIAGVQRRRGEQLQSVYVHGEACRHWRVGSAGRVRDRAVGALGCNGPGAPHHVRQSRQSDARASDCSRARNRRASGDWRVAAPRQLVSESLLLAAVGALGGLLLARWLSRTLVTLLSTESNRIFVDLTPDWRVFAFMAVVVVLACVLFGLTPALTATGTNPARAMQAGGRSATDAREALALRRSLVVLQVALSLVLVVGALLFARSLRNLASVELGFRPDVIATSIDLRRTAVQPEARQETLAEIVTRFRSVPGVRQAAEVGIVPLSGLAWNTRVAIGGRVQDQFVYFNVVGGDYFSVMETPLVAGRPFDGRDRQDAPMAAIVNETFARLYFPNAAPIGQTFQEEPLPGAPRPTYHIVGLVRDTKYVDVREEFLPIAYLPVSQDPQQTPLGIVVQSALPLGSVTPALTGAINEVAPGAMVSYNTVTRSIEMRLVAERLMAWLSGFFGVLAMLIASIGLYGVMSYIVTRRKVEIAVRMALGAEPRRVTRMMVAESGVLLAVGVAIGVALASVALRYAEGLLYGLTPSDATSFALAISMLGIVGVLAAWIPARRASRVDPTRALHYE
ncbi:MAG: FtsX-like permease family protein [Luteitalea sp.]|nr:FtsX-like permease family protein [Luteitalea sp.]